MYLCEIVMVVVIVVEIVVVVVIIVVLASVYGKGGECCVRFGN